MRDPASFLIGNQRNYIQMNMAPISELLSQSHKSGKKPCVIPYFSFKSRASSCILLLSLMQCGDIHPHPGPLDFQQYDCFKRKGLHCLHINIRSLLPKISELRSLVSKASPAVVAISESWLDKSVPDNEINIQEYTVLRHDRNRCGGGVYLCA